MAPFFLARIYSGNHPAYVDHGKAYRIFSEIVDKWGHTVDPSDYRRAPTVAKAMTGMAKYLANGIPEMGLETDKAAALRLYRHAARFYDDAGAQFELAKLQFIGDGVPKDVAMALYWFQKLAHDGHPGAQAFLADLMWKGRHMKHDPGQALALISLAMKNAPPHELWIGDIYQNIYCGSSNTVRQDAMGFVAGWDEQLGASARNLPADRTGGLDGLVRVCRDGEEIKPLHETSAAVARKPGDVTTPARPGDLFLHGDTGGLGRGASGQGALPRPDARLEMGPALATPREANAGVIGSPGTRPAGYELVVPVPAR